MSYSHFSENKAELVISVRKCQHLAILFIIVIFTFLVFPLLIFFPTDQTENPFMMFYRVKLRFKCKKTKQSSYTRDPS